MYKKILAPLDGSQLSECSLEHVKAIATGCKVPEVVLLIVVEEPAPSFSYVGSERDAKRIAEQREAEARKIREEAEDYLAKVAGELKKDGIAVQTAIIQPSLGGGVAEAILDYAHNNKVDIIIMSTHGRSGVSRWAFGSVADKVASHAQVPVLTITAAGCRVK